MSAAEKMVTAMPEIPEPFESSKILRSSYLGDGVYAQFYFDTHELTLTVERTSHPGIDYTGVHIERVGLQRRTFEALQKFARECWQTETPGG